MVHFGHGTYGNISIPFQSIVIYEKYLCIVQCKSIHVFSESVIIGFPKTCGEFAVNVFIASPSF